MIDVNTGKFTGAGGNLEETVTRNNLEAAEEVVRQLRLRDVGGIIVIDFIDMVLEANRDLVLRRLTECLARDRTRHQVAEVTSLGLVQMTRKRVGSGLLEHFSTPCEHCRGRGVVVNAEPIVEPEPGRVERADRVDRESGRRSRNRGRRDSGQPADGESGRRNGSTRNGSPMDVATRTGLDGSLDRGGRSGAPAEPEGPGAEVAAAVDSDLAELAVGAPLAPAPVATDPGEAELPAGVTPGGVADAVEEIVVERSLAERSLAERSQVERSQVERSGADPEGAAEMPSDGPPSVDASAEDAGPVELPRPRRGRVTRTAGAPEPTSGDAPTAAVLTVPGPVTPDTGVDPAVEPIGPSAVPAQPVPGSVTRPRRSRRAASRPAGPPVGETSPESSPEAGSEAGPEAGGDPV